MRIGPTGASRTIQPDGIIPTTIAPVPRPAWAMDVARHENPDQAVLGVSGLYGRPDCPGHLECLAPAGDGRVARNILTNNYDSIVAAQEMQESLARQEAARLGLLLGDGGSAREDLTEGRRRFDAALRSAANNITEPGEAETIATLTQDRDTYYRLVDGFLVTLEAPPPSSPEVNRGRWPELAAGPRGFATMRAFAQLNQQAMVAKAEAATRVATRWFRTRSGSRLRWWSPGSSSRCSSPTASSGPLSLLRATATRIAGGDLDATARSPRMMKSGSSRRTSTGWPSGSGRCAARISASSSSPADHRGGN